MTVDEKIWYQVFRRDKGICQYCGLDLLINFSIFNAAEVDHILAKSSGGSDNPENLVLCCTGCNGMLSRASELKAFETRRNSIQKKHAEKVSWFAQLKGEVLGTR